MFANKNGWPRGLEEDETRWIDSLKPTTISSCIFLFVIAICGIFCDVNSSDYDYEYPDVLVLMEFSINNIQIHKKFFWDWNDPTVSDVDKKLWKNVLKMFFTSIVTLLIHTSVWTPIVATFNFSVISLLHFYEPSEKIPDELERGIAVMNFWITLSLPFLFQQIINLFDDEL